jgi:predicted nucleic acid-binding protein
LLLVVDANILVSELLRKRGRDILASAELSFCISEVTWGEALHELPKRAEKIVQQGRIGQAQTDRLLHEAISLAEKRVLTIPRAIYGAFEQEAAYRIPRDPDDAPTVALALALGGDNGGCAIWTADGDFFGCGVPVWVTDTLAAHLEYHHDR